MHSIKKEKKTTKQYNYIVFSIGSSLTNSFRVTLWQSPDFFLLIDIFPNSVDILISWSAWKLKSERRIQGAMGTNWSIGSSSWTWGRPSSPWGWRSTGTGCPGRLWSLLLWRYSRPAWTRSCAACCRWPCCGRRVGLDDPQRSLPTPTILWFCDSVGFCCHAKFHSL